MRDRGDLWVEIIEPHVWGHVLHGMLPSSITLDHSHPQQLRDFWFWSEVCRLIPKVNTKTKSSSSQMNFVWFEPWSQLCCQHRLRQKFPTNESNHFLKSIHHSETRPIGFPTPQEGLFKTPQSFASLCDSDAKYFNKHDPHNATNFKSHHPHLDWLKHLLVIS